MILLTSQFRRDFVRKMPVTLIQILEANGDGERIIEFCEYHVQDEKAKEKEKFHLDREFFEQEISYLIDKVSCLEGKISDLQGEIDDFEGEIKELRASH